MKSPPSLNAIYEELKAAFSSSPPLAGGRRVWSPEIVARDAGRFRDSLRFLRPHVKPGDRLLDVGGFPGYLGLLYHRYLTPSVTMICYTDDENYRAFMEGLGVKVLFTDITCRDIPPGKYDVVSFTEVIEHILNPAPVLRKLKTAVRPGGLLFISTPNQANLRSRLDFTLRGKSTWYPVTEDVCKEGEKGHVRAYTHAEIAELLETAGFEVLRHGSSTWATHKLHGGGLPNPLKRLIPPALRRGIFVLARALGR